MKIMLRYNEEKRDRVMSEIWGALLEAAAEELAREDTMVRTQPGPD